MLVHEIPVSEEMPMTSSRARRRRVHGNTSPRALKLSFLECLVISRCVSSVKKCMFFFRQRLHSSPVGKRVAVSFPPAWRGRRGGLGEGAQLGYPKRGFLKKSVNRSARDVFALRTRTTPAARPSSCTWRLPRSCGIPYTLTRTPFPSPENKLSGVNVTEPQPSRDLGAAGPRNSGQATCGPVSSQGGAGPARGDGRARHTQALFPWQQQSSEAFDTVFKNTGAATLT